jgi:protein-S-isoprenylcysteine O-methyltransferase Ste14
MNPLLRTFQWASRRSRSVRILISPLGVIIFFLMVAAMVAASLYLDKWAGLPPLVPDHLKTNLSLVLIAPGLLLVLWSILQFKGKGGTPIPLNPASELVHTGPYKHVRNPMLLGWFILLFGLGVYLQSIFMFFVFTPLFILMNYMELRCVEELDLVDRLGEPYIIYRDSIPMFFPRVRKSSSKHRADQ